MRSFLRFCCLFVFVAILSNQNVLAQKDIFKGILEKEDPVFNSTITKSENDGEILIDFYFTHSKISELEVSFWIKDLGTNLETSQSKQLIKGLEEYGNRKSYSIVLPNLKNLHFYTIGIDYRNPSSISKKFISKSLENSYFYESNPKNGNNPPVVIENSTPKEDLNIPCIDPDIQISIDPSGYCQAKNKPAIFIQCTNCQGRQWEFNVEIKKENNEWKPLRADGLRQKALGTALRTEPFCALNPGLYEVQVLAWGENCELPIVQKLPTSLIIPEQNKLNAFQSTSIEETAEKEELTERDIQLDIPETCTVLGVAYLRGDKIEGTIELDLNSPCSSMNPTALIKYIHPGHRDITLDEIYLLPGSKIPFEIPLDNRDLNRGIHTLQIIEQINLDQRIQLGSSWIKAIEEKSNSPYKTEELTTNAPKEPYQPTGFNEDEFSIDEQELSTVSVTASDPNCNQIQDLQLVYGSGKADLPLFISWLSPRCCQEEGCSYTVWAGEDHNKLRLLIKGSKPGAIVRELLQNINAYDEYFEIVVKTGNGTRKAAYVIGEGPKYGFEEILSYRDEIDPQESDDFTFQIEPDFAFQQPSLAIDNFRSCRIFRETSISKSYDVSPGESITVSYDYTEKGYQYTLYLLPDNSTEWVVAPSTEELSSQPTFTFATQKEHAGKYVILAYNPALNWGCLSKPVSEAIPLVIAEE